MLYIDPHIHCISRITDDYAAQFQHGVRVVIEPSFWLGQPRTSVGTFRDYFLMIQEWEAQRAMEKGIHHRCLIALNPKEANDDMVREPVLEILPEFLDHPNVLGVGEVGYDAITPAEEDAMIRQIKATHHIPAVLPHGPLQGRTV